MKRIALYMLLPLALLAQDQPNPPDAPNPPGPPQSFRPGPPMQGRPMRGPGMMQGGPMMGRPMFAGQPGPRPFAAMQPPDYRALKEYLNLSDTQIRDMEQAREKALREAGDKEKSLRPEIEQKHLALANLLDTANPDPAAVGRAMLEVHGLEKQIRQAREAVRTSELNVLTPEQRTKFKAVQDAANLPEAARDARRLGLVGPPPPPAAPRPPQPPPARQ